MKTKKTIIVMLFLIANMVFSECSYIDEKMGFDRPKVISIYPSNFMTDVASNVIVEVSFSKSMDTIKTNESFSLSSASGNVDGYFRWSNGDKRMTFEPKNSLTDAQMYTIIITSEAEDKDGNDLEETHTTVFYVNTDLNPPTVIANTPANDATGILPDASIIITFSEAMDIDTIYDGITITPAVQGTYSWNGTCTVITFDPLYDLSYGTTYTVTLSESLKDVNGNALRDQQKFSFTVGDDFIKPTVQTVRQNPEGTAPAGYTLNDPWQEGSINYAIEKQNNILITFSEPVLRNTMYDAITITPGCDFSIQANPTDTVATLMFNAPMNSESNYTLTIETIISDVQNNALDREYVFHYFTNSVNSLRPTVEYITDPNYDTDGWDYPPSDPDASQDYWTLGSTETLSWADPYTNVHIIFSAVMDPETVTVTIERVIGTAGPAYMVEPDWPNIAPALLRVYEFDLEGVQAGNTYRITVKGGSKGAKDVHGNYMKEDFVQYVRF